MILIADSGSTKTDWRLIVDKDNVQEAYTEGLNPYFKTTEEVQQTINDVLLLQFITKNPMEIDAVYFYGAGCSSDDKKEIIATALKSVFTNANIVVEHDLLGAALGVCGTQAGIAAILGTGSNSCYFDGEKVVENIPALGYVLGDEGSGAYIGKEVLKGYLNKEMDDAVLQKFELKFKPSLEGILDRVYKEALPNRYFASFAKWVGEEVENEKYLQEIVRKALDAFFKKHICKYENHTELPLNVVGSIGYHFMHILHQVGENYNVKLGKVIKSPISGLVKHHMDN